MVTLRAVAREAGVSPATASLAVRGHRSVAAATMEKVQTVARRLGYRPNPLLASLAAKGFRQPAVTRGAPLAVFHFPHAPNLPAGRSLLYSDLLLSEARELGYAPEEFLVQPDTDPAKLGRKLRHRMCLGIIVTGSIGDGHFLESFPWSDYSIVQCARFHALQPFHTVRPNIFQAVKLVFDQLQSRGYLRIGFAIARHRVTMEDDSARFGAAIAMERDYLPKSRQLPVFRGRIGDTASFLSWLKSSRPDAVVGFSPEYLKFLLQAGFHIPESLGFASLHLLDPEQYDCSGLKQNPDMVARESIHLLDQLIRRGQRGLPKTPLQVLVPSDWNEGTTVRALV